MRFRLRPHPLFLAVLSAIGTMAHGADTVQLPAVEVSALRDPTTLGAPVAAGSNLALTPLETPASVSVITRQQLDARGDTAVVDAITRAPGFSSLAHPGNSGSSLSVRGFTDTTSVMRLYDGMRQYGGVGVSFPFDTWSVERIEVLRGPASVIHGDGAIGGVINVVPRKPTQGEIRNDVQVTVGSDETRRAAFGSGGAINEALSYRLDVSGGRSGGWVNLGDSRDLTFSGAIQLDVSRDLRFKLSHASGRQEPMRYFGSPLIGNTPRDSLRDRNYNVADSHIEYKDHWTELSMDWTPDATTSVRSKIYQIDSTRYWRNSEAYFYNAATGLIDRDWDTEIRHRQSQIGTTHVASFGGQLFGLRNQVSLGFDASSSTFRHTNNTYTGQPDPVSVDPYNPIAGHYVSAVPFIPRYENRANQYSVFAEDRLELSNRWSVVAGLRHDHAKVSRDNLLTHAQAFEQTFSNTGWRLGTVYLLNPDLSLYAQYAEAADPVRSMLFLSPANSRFKLTTGRQAEVGVKQILAGGRGEWTVSVYDIQKKNMLTRDPTNPGVSVQVGEQSSRGIEGTLSLAVARNWQFDANVSVLHARFDDFSENVGGVAVSRKGNLPTDVPEKLANAWLSWNFVPAWTAGVGVRYVGERFADAANTLRMPSYTVTDMALQWKLDNRTSLVLRGLNVFDKAYFTTAYYNTEQWLYGPARQVLVTLNHRF